MSRGRKGKTLAGRGRVLRRDDASPEVVRRRVELPTPPPSVLPGRLEASLSALNAVLGDYLKDRANGLEIEMQLHVNNRPVRCDREGLARAYPDASHRICLLVHGLGTHEGVWSFPADRAVSYGSLLQKDLGYTPCYVRYNSGLHISENGRSLAELLEALVRDHPVEVKEIAVLGYSMGGLVVRSACDVAAREGHGWVERVKRIVYIGAPHLGAPLEKIGNVVAWVLRTIDVPHTKLVADVIDLRSSGIKDMRYANLAPEDWQGFDPDVLLEDHRKAVPLAPRAAHHLVVGTLTGGERHVLTRLFGDAMVRVPSAAGRSRDGKRSPVFPQENVRIFPGLGHVALAHDRAVYEQIRAWLGGELFREEGAS